MDKRLVTVLVVAILVLFGVTAAVLSKNKGSSNDHHTANSSMTNFMDSQPQTVNTVAYKDFEVAPKTIKIKVGTTVTWTNEDTAKHDITPDDPSDDFKASELFGKGQTYQWTFNKVGMYSYRCSPHPYMKGTIEVVE